MSCVCTDICRLEGIVYIIFFNAIYSHHSFLKLCRFLISFHVSYIFILNRLTLDLGAFTFRESSNQRSASASAPVSASASTPVSACAMEDEVCFPSLHPPPSPPSNKFILFLLQIDMLLEENESLLEKVMTLNLIINLQLLDSQLTQYFLLLRSFALCFCLILKYGNNMSY